MTWYRFLVYARLVAAPELGAAGGSGRRRKQSDQSEESSGAVLSGRAGAAYPPVLQNDRPAGRASWQCYPVLRLHPSAP